MAVMIRIHVGCKKVKDFATAGRGSKQAHMPPAVNKVEELNLRTPSNIRSTFAKGQLSSPQSFQEMPTIQGSDLPYSDSSDGSLSDSEGGKSVQQDQVGQCCTTSPMACISLTLAWSEAGQVLVPSRQALS